MVPCIHGAVVPAAVWLVLIKGPLVTGTTGSGCYLSMESNPYGGFGEGGLTIANRYWHNSFLSQPYKRTQQRH
jgi:hypothetical protein